MASSSTDGSPPSGRHSMAIVRLFRCITGPKLRRMYFQGRNAQGTPYTPNKLETYADNVILAVYLLFSFAYHVTPIYFIYRIVRSGFPSIAGVLGTLKTLAFVPISFSLAYVVRVLVTEIKEVEIPLFICSCVDLVPKRGIGRFRNDTYNEFLISLGSTRQYFNRDCRLGPTEARTTGIDGYDFEMFAYPVTFRHDESAVKPRRLSSPRRKGLVEKLIHFPLYSMRCLAAHVVARRLIYPGSNTIFKLLLETPLSQGRSRLRREYDAFRAKLLTADGNHIDSVFVDKRGSPDVLANGNKLVICCEGNAAYYELGLIEVPLQAGFSVIGWNHPGFGESTGLPFPDQEFHAIDVVIRYAVTYLGFSFENIILLAWSIGGYTATCAAMSYPDIGGVILDATFDDIAPLVKSRVPTYLEKFTLGMVKECYNLNIAEQISHYSGPVTVIRRDYDEMMSFNNDVSTNRANYLLIKILQTRYPNLVSPEPLRELWRWLVTVTDSDRSGVLSQMGVVSSRCRAQLVNYMSENGPEYPWLIGGGVTVPEKTKLLLYLASQYMRHYDSTHCQPLPSSYLYDLPGSHGNIRQ